MSSVAELRAKIAARRATDLARVDICIDRDQAQTITDLEERLASLDQQRTDTLAKAKEDSQRGDRRLGDSPVAKIDTAVAEAEAALDAAWDAAADDTVRIVLRSLPPEGEVSWQGFLVKHADLFGDADYPAAWCADIVAASYVRAETTTGEDLGYTWPEVVAELLFAGDYERVWRQAIIHNRKSPNLDFSKRRSVSRRRAAK